MNKLLLRTLAIVLTISVAACSPNNEKTTTANDEDTTVTSTESAAKPADLSSLATLNGQYPTDVGLLDNPLINDRLKALLGSEYADFRKYWNTETPIVVEAHVLSTSGCEVHNCAANQYLLQIDLKNNNINVYHLGKDIQRYLEKGPIDLPEGLAKEFDTIIGNRPV